MKTYNVNLFTICGKELTTDASDLGILPAVGYPENFAVANSENKAVIVFTYTGQVRDADDGFVKMLYTGNYEGCKYEAAIYND